MKRRLLAVIMAAAMVAGLAGCGGGSSSSSAPAEGSTAAPAATSAETDVLYLNLASEPNYIDPALNTTVDGATLIVNSFTGLYTYNNAGECVPALADGEAEVSEDGLTYTFKLIESKWSDGSEVTAKDFEYAWKRAAADETGADYQYLFDIFARNDDGSLKVECPDDYTLTCELLAPCPYFVSLTTFPAFLPVPQDEIEAADPDGTNPSAWCQEAGFKCNGAYKMAEWKHNESMTYVANENWYLADTVKIKELNMMLSDDDTAIYAAYNSGNLDFIDTVPNDELPNLISNPEFHLADQLATYFVCFNVNSPLFEGKTPEEAAKMRKAISMLVDRTYLMDNITLNATAPADAFVCPLMDDGNGGEFHQSYYDGAATGAGMMEDAKALLEECGYTFTEANGGYQIEPALSFTYMINESDAHKKVAEAIQQDMAVLGINMTIEQEDWNVFVDDRKNGNYDVARHGWVADYSDAINMLEMWESISGNDDAQLGKDVKEYAPQNWEEYDTLVEGARLETDPAKRADMLHQAEDMLMETGAIMPLYYYADVYMQKANVEGVFTTVYGNKYFYEATKN